MKKGKSLLALLVTFLMVASNVPTVFALRTTQWPFRNSTGRLLADSGTRYYTDITQDPDTGIISATVKIENEGASSEALHIDAITTAISFSDAVSPINNEGEMLVEQVGSYLDDADETELFRSYITLAPGIQAALSNHRIQTDSAARVIGTVLRGDSEEFHMGQYIILPGTTRDIVTYRFKTKEEGAKLTGDMFQYKVVKYLDIENHVNSYNTTSWRGDIRYLVPDPYFIFNPSAVAFSMHPELFKLHIKQVKPVFTTNDVYGTVNEYNEATMEWSLTPDGTYTTAAPSGFREGDVIYIRMAETEYGEASGPYVDYKKLLASDPAMVIFGKGETADIPLIDDAIEDDTVIKGSVPAYEEGATVTVTVTRDGQTVYGPQSGISVNPDGTWVLPLDDGFVLELGDTMKAYQTVPEKLPSTEVTKDVGARAVSDAPDIDKITEGDRTVSGDGIPGSDIEVTFPGMNPEDEPVKADVNEDGRWTVTVPDGIDLEEDDVVTAVQIEKDEKPSPEAEEIVAYRGEAHIESKKTSENLTSTDGKTYVGDKLAFTITVENDGEESSKLVNTVVTDEIPEGLDYTHTDISVIIVTTTADGETISLPAGSAANFDGDILTVQLGDIPQGVKKEILFVATVADGAEGLNVRNAADITAKDGSEDGGDLDDRAEEDKDRIVEEIIAYDYGWKSSENVTEPPHADGRNYVGDTFEYTIGIQNPGETLLTDVELTDAVPNYVTFVADSLTIDGAAAVLDTDYTLSADDVLDIQLGDIEVGASKEVTFLVTVDDDAYGQVILNTVTVSTPDDEEEIVEEGGGREIEDGVVATAVKTSDNLDIEGDDADQATYPGDTIRFTIALANEAESADSIWEDIIVGDALPQYVTFVPDSVQIDGAPADYVYNETLRALSIFAGSLAGGESRTVTFEATVDQDAVGHEIKNIATVKGIPDDVVDDDPFTPVDAKLTVTLDPTASGAILGKAQGETQDIEVTVYSAYGVLPTAEKAGYALDGWYTQADEKVTAETIVTIREDHTLTARYTAVADGITVDFETGAADVQPPASIQVTAGEAYGELPVVSRDGYTFDGWFTADDVLIESDSIVETVSNHTLYAHWTALQYTVSFESNWEDIPNPSDQTVTFGEAYGTLPMLTKAGYHFDGWYTSDTFATKVDAETLVSIPGDHTLYAKWTEAGIVVTFDKNTTDAVTPEPTSKTVRFNNAYGTLPNPFRADWRLDGWFAEADGGAQVTADVIVTANENHTLYAHWTARSQRPEIDPIEEGADEITGGGVPEADIVVTLPDGSEVETVVDDEGKWSVDVPEGVELKPGQTVTATQTEEGKPESDPEDEVVTGYVNLTVYFDGNAADARVSEDSKTVSLGHDYGTLPSASREGYSFVGWYTTVSGGLQISPSTIVSINGNHTLYAHWATKPDKPIQSEDIKEGGDGGDGDTEIIDDNPPLSVPILDKENHFPYIAGYPDQTVRPDAPITRAEVAMIFYKLIINEDKATPLFPVFNDVDNDAWYAQAVNYLAVTDIISGYTDNSFRPDTPITRAEFATISSKFDNLDDIMENAFPDVADDHWAKGFINSAAAKGWVAGYTDGTFKPDMNITRSEVVTVVNTMLERSVRLQDIPLGIIDFYDLDTGHWAYADIVEASNDHDYTRDTTGYELWTLK